MVLEISQNEMTEDGWCGLANQLELKEECYAVRIEIKAAVANAVVVITEFDECGDELCYYKVLCG